MNTIALTFEPFNKIEHVTNAFMKYACTIVTVRVNK